MEEDGGHGWEEVYAAYGCSSTYVDDEGVDELGELPAVERTFIEESRPNIPVEDTAEESVWVRVRPPFSVPLIPSPG